MVDAARADHGARRSGCSTGTARCNRERKVGNITDWVERWGGAYDFMLVLDADSLMEAETILELARRMRGRLPTPG